MPHVSRIDRHAAHNRQRPITLNAGQGRYQIFTWPGRRLRSARLDPDSKLLLEGRRLDNHRAAPEFAPADGLSRPVGDLGEALTLTLLGGLSL